MCIFCTAMPSRPPQPGAQGFELKGEFDGYRYSFRIRPGENRLGSTESNDLILPVPEVSRRHAVVHVGEDGVTVEDLGSKNGTFVNGQRVTQARLREGDLICFGIVVLRLVAVPSSDASLAISIDSSEQKPRAKREPRWSKTQTPSGAEASAPARWLRVLERAAVELRSGEAAVPLALEIVMTGLGADGAALLDLASSDEPTVEHTCGAWRLPPDLARLTEEASARTAAGEGGSGDVIVNLPGPPPLIAAVDLRQGAGARALVAAGNFPGRDACGALLAAALRLIGQSGSRGDAGQTTKHRRPVSGLVFPPGYVAGRSDAMRSVYHQLRALLKGDLRVLITGETGVGKEHIARILHASSPRATGPFEAVNCAAIPTELLEAELFGIEAGVATGVAARVGRMVAAKGGVVFLDEIGEMSPALQAKLLRVLEEKAAHPVGARRPVPLDVRILSATNCDLQTRMNEGRFRPDLFYRVAGYTLEVPPLRDRREDIPALVEHFIREFAAELGTSVRGISVKALRALEAGPWNGNVRELAFEVRRLVYLCPEGEAITSALVSPELRTTLENGNCPAPPAPGDLSERRHKDDLDRKLIAEALARAGGKKVEAAKLLEMSPHGLRKMMRRLGLDE